MVIQRSIITVEPKAYSWGCIKTGDFGKRIQHEHFKFWTYERRHCREPVHYAHEYRYTNPQRKDGKPSICRKYYCITHIVEIAVKYALTIPDWPQGNVAKIVGEVALARASLVNAEKSIKRAKRILAKLVDETKHGANP